MVLKKENKITFSMDDVVLNPFVPIGEFFRPVPIQTEEEILESYRKIKIEFLEEVIKEVNYYREHEEFLSDRYDVIIEAKIRLKISNTNKKLQPTIKEKKRINLYQKLQMRKRRS